MNIRQERRFKMYLAVIEFLIANTVKLAALPNLTKLLGILQNCVDQIKIMSEQQSLSKRGISATKKQLRSALVALVADVSRRLTAYATFVNNQVLLAEIKYSTSDFNRFSDSSLRYCAQGVYDKAQANLGELATYGITEEPLNALQLAIRAFESAIPTPRLGIIRNRQCTVLLIKYFDEGDKALEGIDLIVDMIKVTEAKLYEEYRTARKVVDAAACSLTLKGVVTDAGTGNPIKGATLSFSPSSISDTMTVAMSDNISKDGVLLTKKTAEKGGFNIKSLPEGSYTVLVKKIGYRNQELSITVSNDDLEELNISLAKS
ncbi:MAG: carboxypeptidase regulatory-like domain-containing protein [Bacteroidales bacterium]